MNLATQLPYRTFEGGMMLLTEQIHAYVDLLAKALELAGVAIIVGGLGSLLGTLIGGLMIGVASGLAAVYFPSATEAVMYVMMGLVLLVRPRGLLGEEGRLH